MMGQKGYTASMRGPAANSMDETHAIIVDDAGNSSVLLVARCLVAGLFLWSGIGQVQGYDETAAFMIHHGVMSNLLPVAVFIELAGAILLIVGYRMRFTALASFSVLTALLFNATLSDVETGYKLIDREVLDSLDLTSDRFDFEPEITAKLLRRGYRIYEVPVTYAGRAGTEGRKFTWRDGLAAARTLIRLRLQRSGDTRRP